HSQLKTGHPVRSAIHKQLNGRLVLRWVTTWESLLLYVLYLFLLQLTPPCCNRDVQILPSLRPVATIRREHANMATAYDVQTYLLDKSNIKDTVTRMMYAFDNNNSSLLIDQVYTPEIHLDYDTLLLGGKPEIISSKAWADRLEHMHDAYDTTQHTVHNFLIELPQPSSANNDVARPDSCTVYAHADGWFYNRNVEGRPRIMCRRNGGKYRLEVVRLKDKEEQGENPWRIHKQRVELSWQDMGSQ
ncbi:hypothetical protein KCU98_g279, partial [Aureobasidium melanogenum]